MPTILKKKLKLFLYKIKLLYIWIILIQSSVQNKEFLVFWSLNWQFSIKLNQKWLSKKINLISWWLNSFESTSWNWNGEKFILKKNLCKYFQWGFNIKQICSQFQQQHVKRWKRLKNYILTHFLVSSS